MTENEKDIYFAGEKPEDTNYEVIEILQPRLREIARPQEETQTTTFLLWRDSILGWMKLN